MSSADYRADIDGLRALAIVPVVLFHVAAPGFHGGFVGVDVFFVISGYLITGIVARDVAAGRFSLLEFYRRRALRIFPALFVMLAVCAAVAYATMLPGELVAFAKSMLATALFSSNLFFHQSSGYFAPAAHAMPLLHTWSLAVEEQFYLVWPLLLMALARSAQRAAVWLAAGIAALSFSAATWGLSQDPSGSFYLSHTRAWELLIGALLVWLPPRALAHRALRELLAGLGLAAILVAVKFFNQGTPFPGPMALVPVLGAAALIAAGAAGPTAVGRLLSLRPVVFVGTVSFSLYLWHWPLIVFAQTALFLEQTAAIRTLLVLMAFGLAVLSWRFVETPFRRGAPARPTRRVLARAATVMAAFVATSSIAVMARGFPDRFDAQQQLLASYESYEGDKAYRAGSCFVVQPGDAFDRQACLTRDASQPALLIVGDSHAAHLWPGLHAAATTASVLQATRTGCRPLLKPLHPDEPACQRFFRELFTDWLPAHPVDALVLAGRWHPSDLPFLLSTLQALQPHARQVMVVGPAPQYASALPRLLVHALRSNDPDAVGKGLVRAEFALDASMRSLLRDSPARYFSLIDTLCPQGACRLYASADVPLQFDYGHFTIEGSKVVGATLTRAIQSGPPP